MLRAIVRFILLTATIFVILGFMGHAIAELSAQRDEGLWVWKEQHQAADNQQFADIAALSKKLVEADLKNEARLTRLETEYSAVRADLDGLTSKIWYLIVGVVLQLIGMVYRVLTERRADRVRARVRSEISTD